MMRKRNGVSRRPATAAPKKKAGRPPKPPQEVKSIRERIYFSPLEIQRIDLAVSLLKTERGIFTRTSILEAADRVIREKALGNL